MKTQRTSIVICGAATLFAACESSSDAPASGTAEVTGADASTSTDTALIGDVSDPGDVADEADGLPLDDTGGVAEEVTTTADTLEGEDTWADDASEADVTALDAVMSDVEPADTESFDAGAPDVDPGEVASVDTTDPADIVTAEIPKEGAPCDGMISVWCNEKAEAALDCVYAADGSTWQVHSPNGLPCYCDAANSPGAASCAVPGFVGIDRAGRVRQGPTLRALRRTPQYV
jgi:hypothetical protein